MIVKNEDLIFKTFNFVIYFLLINLVVSSIFSFVYPSFRVYFAIEVLVTSVAGFIYYLIINTYKAGKKSNSIDWDKITTLRYIDWAITTPLLLLSFNLFLSKGEKVNNLGNFIVMIILFDLIMILSGYLGSFNIINNTLSQFIGFFAYFVIFYSMYNKFIKGKLVTHKIFKQIFFYIMLVLWFLYGVIYNASVYNRNAITNILDGITKGIFGLSLAFYLILEKNII
jgi:bacteriorhodopsin